MIYAIVGRYIQAPDAKYIVSQGVVVLELMWYIRCVAQRRAFKEVQLVVYRGTFGSTAQIAGR